MELGLFNDSIQKVIQTEKDSKKLRLNITDLLNRNYATNKPFVIKYIENNILDREKYTKDTIFYANTLNTYAICFLDSDPDRCIQIIKQGIDYIGKNERPEVLEKLALLNTNMANALAALGHYNTQLKVFADIQPIILKTNNAQIIRHYNFKLGVIYYQINELDKAIEHLNKGIFLEEDFVWHPNFAGTTETVLASIYFKMNKIDSVRKYINIANKIKRVEFPPIFNARVKNLLAITEAYDGNFDIASSYLDESYQIALATKDSSEIMYSIYVKGCFHVLKKNYSYAIETFEQILKNYPNSDLDHYRYYVLISLIEAYKLNNQDEKAFETYDNLLHFLQEQKVKNLQLYTEELSYNMKYNEKMAELEKLKSSNEKIEITKQRNQIFIAALAITSASLLLVLGLITKAQKRNKLLGKQRYALLEAKLEEAKNNRMIDEMKLLKQIEDRERNRIATDLHDSIGGLLSSIKIALYSYQEANNLQSEDLAHTNRVLDYVDETKQELNRIVYNLTPLIVEKFGLLEAVKEYSKKIQSEHFSIYLQLINMPAGIVQEDEITIYRIIQEVLHNIVRHANATYALLQIQTLEDKGMVVISIEDNGKGMNLNEAKIQNGLGMLSLYSRVQNLNGTVKIESVENEGASFYITCFPRVEKEDIS